jgi:hypothetical protein
MQRLPQPAAAAVRYVASFFFSFRTRSSGVLLQGGQGYANVRVHEHEASAGRSRHVSVLARRVAHMEHCSCGHAQPFGGGVEQTHVWFIAPELTCLIQRDGGLQNQLCKRSAPRRW